jgi:hypothetical protein
LFSTSVAQPGEDRILRIAAALRCAHDSDT